MSKRTGLTAGLLVASGVLALAGAAEAQPKRGGDLVMIGVAGSPRHLNGAVQSGVATAQPSTQIFASLVRYDDKWNALPYLAKSWELSPDGKALTFKLVDNAVFHDGRPVTSADVAFSIMTVKANHPFQTMLAPVTGVDTPDPLTAVLRFEKPHPAAMLALSTALAPILPKHVYDDGTDVKVHARNATPVGSGPFKLAEFKAGEHIVLERFDKFFIPGRPYLDRIIIRIMNDQAAMVIGMERQELHVYPLSTNPRNVERLGQQGHLVVTDKGYDGIGPINWLAFNTKKPPLDRKEVRQAISYAIDREFITKRLMAGMAKIATGPIMNGTPFYTDGVEPYRLDLDKANALLDQAGLKRGADGNRMALSIDFIPTGGPDQQKNVAEYLKPQLKKIGIDLTVRTAPDFPTWAQRVGGWDFDMTMDNVFNWGDPVIGVHRTYLSSNIRKGVIWSNTQQYSNTTVDDLLEKAQVEIDPAKRKAHYVAFQRQVVEDAPIAFINVSPFYTIYHKNLANPPLSIWGTMAPFDEVYWEAPPK